MSLKDKQSANNLQEEWINDISKKYLDLNNVNSYRSGLYGYINEVMSNVSEEVYNAVSTVRREFYPNSATYSSSLYKMAALQKLDAPMATPGICNAALVIKEDDILPTIKSNTNMDNSYYINNNVLFMADDIPFMLDYPIIITGRPNDQIISSPSKKDLKKRSVKERYAYTTRYDISKSKNSLDDSNTLYLKNKVIEQYGERVLLIEVKLRQVKRQTEEFTINKNSQLSVVTQDISYNGMIANFEVFYKEDDGSQEIQLIKQILGSEFETKPFCQYMLLDGNTLRIHFPDNIYFIPKFNATVRVEIYTTLGEEGNFDRYDGDLICNNENTVYSKSMNIVIAGQTIGPCAGGTSIPSFEDFRREVVYAYTTNKTICTNNDLQEYFDKKSLDTHNKILFFKKRDDVFQRLYGAYILLKNLNDYVIPSNTNNIRLMRGYIDGDGNLSNESDFDAYYESSKRLILKPGAIFRYGDSNNSDRYTLKRDKSLNLLKDMKFYELYSNDIRSACRNMYNGKELPIVYEDTSDHFIYRFHTDDEIYQMEDKEEKEDLQKIEKIKTDILNFLKKKNGSNFNIDLNQYIKFYTMRHEIEYTPKEKIKETIVFIEYHLCISYFLYTNPFLISVLTSPNAVAYYLTSADDNLPCKYAEVASGADSYIQFILNTLHVDRNALLGENFYKFTINIMASVDTYDSNKENLLVSNAIVKVDQTSTINYVIAETDGIVESIKYYKHFKNTDNSNKTFESIEEFKKYIKDMKYLEDFLQHSIAHINNYNGEPADLIWDPEKDDFVVQKFSTYSGVYDGVYARVKALRPFRDGTYWSLMIRISPVIEFDNTHKENGFSILSGFNMLYEIGETFNAQNQIAIRKVTDTGIVKCFITINDSEFDNKMMHIPMIIEDYNQEGDYFTLSAYVATDDELGSNGTMHLTDGVFYDEIDLTENTHDWKEIDSKMCYISMDRTDFSIYTFIQYEDMNVPKYENYLYVKNNENEKGQWTFTNKYTVYTKDSGFALMRQIQYIRSTALAYMSNENGYVPDSTDPEEDEDHKHCKYLIKSSPVINSEWVKTVSNSKYLNETIRTNYNIINLIYNYLEENFAIDMKFFNTYGRSRFYRVGNKNEDYLMRQLDRVNITFKIGISVNSLSPVDILKERVKLFIRNYIESLNDINAQGKPLYIMNLISEIKKEFDEIGYLEFYGFNDYGPETQKIESTFNDSIENLSYNDYVPEFINIDDVDDNDSIIPGIQITILS